MIYMLILTNHVNPVLRNILTSVLSTFRLTVPAAFANVAGLAEGPSDFDATLPV